MNTPATALFTGRIYPGLRPFDTGDALLFFGREEQTDELLRRLEDTRFLAVVGLSGSGKSSLVRAGLLPALRRGHLAGAGSEWRTAIMRPGSDPLSALTRSLDETLGKREDRPETLRSGRLGLLDTSRYGRAADENLLLVVDQFEEIFRFQDSHRQRADEAAEFVESLLAACQECEAAWRVYVVITMRSDHLGECSRFRGLPEALNDSQYLTPRMTRDELREAMVGPAALGGVELDAGLVEMLLDRTGDEPDQLPVLQHLLMRMWEKREGSRITEEQYNSVGGWDDALNLHAEAVWGDLGAHQDLAMRMFQRLTEKGLAGREVRRPAPVVELAGLAGSSVEGVFKVVRQLRTEECNFLTSPDPDGKLTVDSVIDISHESLIRRWARLNEWATEEADWGQWYRRVEDRVPFRSWLVGGELESALQARDKGKWNETWAERYQKKADDAPAYSEVVRFLEESRKRRTDELSRLKRTRVLLAAAAVLFAALFAVASYSWLTAREARRQADNNAGEAFSQRLTAERGLGDLRKKTGETVAALKLAQEQQRIAVRNAEEAARQRSRALARQLAADSGLLRNSSIDATAATLLAVESLRRAETVQGYEALWGASYRMAREVARLEHQGSVSRVVFSPDGTLVATGSRDKTARVFEARTGREVARLAHEDDVSAVAFSPDSTLVATGSVDKTARVFEVHSGREVARLAHESLVWAVAFSPDGTLVATGSYDKTARVFEARTGREVARLAHEDGVSAVAFSPDGTLVATGSRGKTARVFEARTGREVARLAHEDGVSAVVFSPDGTLVATGSRDKTARVFEARTGREVARLAHQDVVSAVAFSPDSTLVATGSRDKTARVFEVHSGREVARLALGEPAIQVGFVAGGHFLRAVSHGPGGRLHITQDPIRPADLIADACSKLDRNLTAEEWATYLGTLLYRKTCEQLNPLARSGQK